MIHASKPPPWPEGGPKIETFASGLIRKTQAYLVPTDQANVIAAQYKAGTILDAAGNPTGQAGITGSQMIPSIGSAQIDPFVVHPNPIIDPQNNGFARITVTAYSRDESLTINELQYQNRYFPGWGQILAPSYRIVQVFRADEIFKVPDLDGLVLENPFIRPDGSAFESIELPDLRFKEQVSRSFFSSLTGILDSNENGAYIGLDAFNPTIGFFRITLKAENGIGAGLFEFAPLWGLASLANYGFYTEYTTNVRFYTNFAYDSQIPIDQGLPRWIDETREEIVREWVPTRWNSRGEVDGWTEVARTIRNPAFGDN